MSSMVIVPIAAAFVFLIIAYMVDSEQGEIPTILKVMFIVFTIFALYLAATAAIEDQEHCEWTLNSTIEVENEAIGQQVANTTVEYFYYPECHTHEHQSVGSMHKFMMWMIRLLAGGFILFLIWWVFTSLADKEKLT